MHRGYGAGLAVLITLGCDPADYPQRPKPVDAGTPADCAAACSRLEQLGCEEAKPTPKGQTCQQVCEHVEASGDVTLMPACVVQIERCDDIEQCSYGRDP